MTALGLDRRGGYHSVYTHGQAVPPPPPAHFSAALAEASANGEARRLRTFLDNKARSAAEYDALFRSAAQELTETVVEMAAPFTYDALRLLAQEGVDLEDFSDRNNLNPLLAYASRGQLAQVSFLLGMGVNPNTRNKYGWTAVSFAVTQRDAYMMRLLFMSGACHAKQARLKDFILKERELQKRLYFGSESDEDDDYEDSDSQTDDYDSGAS